MTHLLLSARDLTVRRGRKDLLAHLSLVATSSEFIAVLGPSGSGKSTLLKALLGLIPPSSGEVRVNGKAQSPSAWQGRLGYVPQDDIVHAALRVDESLRYAAALRLGETPIGDRPERVLRQLGLWEHRRQRIRTLSGGQRKRVSIAMELLSEPELLVLDEPTSGLDPGLEAALMRQLAGLAAAGMLVLATTHAMASLDLAHRVLVIHGGYLIYDGPPQAMPTYFGVANPEAVFPKLTSQPPVDWAAAFQRQGGRRGIGS